MGLQALKRGFEKMKRMGFMRKCLSLFLVLALCLSCVSGASAEELEQAGTVPETDRFAEEDGSAADQEFAAVLEPAPDPETKQAPESAPFYSDVDQGRWSYAAIRALFDLGITPAKANFNPGKGCTRLDFINMLYQCYLSIRGLQGGGETGPWFSDVLPGSEGYDAVMWAASNGVTTGISDTEFGPGRVLSRQEGAVFVISMARSCGISLQKVAEMTMFRDADDISEYARSAVTACQMAKLLSGKENGRFDPKGTITNEEAAALVYQLYRAASKEITGGGEWVSTEPHAYEETFLQKLFYLNVPETSWAYQHIQTLHEMGMYAGIDAFQPTASSSRLEFVKMLYKLHLALNGAENQQTSSNFTDVPVDSDGFDAVMWAWSSGVTSGVGNGKFGPTEPVTREQCAEFLVHMARTDQIPLVKRENASLFQDSARISKYARSSVTACQMADVINGYGGKFLPQDRVSNQETAALVCKFLDAARSVTPDGAELVSTEKDAYLDLYSKVDYVFGTPVPASDPVPTSWFDDAAFVGDSVSQGLELYQNSTGALGKATMLCSRSFNAINALLPVSSSSLHPTYQGVKRPLEDNIKACGAKKVYIMLGINGLTYSTDYTLERLETMVNNIVKKNPNVKIIMESITPMTNNSTLTQSGYTNSRINQYNERIKKLCAKHKWYYVDVGAALKDSTGAMRTDFCSDNYEMGIHVNFDACAAWVKYLKTHVPDELR